MWQTLFRAILNERYQRIPLKGRVKRKIDAHKYAKRSVLKNSKLHTAATDFKSRKNGKSIIYSMIDIYFF